MFLQFHSCLKCPNSVFILRSMYYLEVVFSKYLEISQRSFCFLFLRKNPCGKRTFPKISQTFFNTKLGLYLLFLGANGKKICQKYMQAEIETFRNKTLSSSLRALLILYLTSSRGCQLGIPNLEPDTKSQSHACKLCAQGTWCSPTFMWFLEPGQAIMTSPLLRLLRRPHKCTNALYNTKISQHGSSKIIYTSVHSSNRISKKLSFQRPESKPIISTTGFEEQPCIGL